MFFFIIMLLATGALFGSAAAKVRHLRRMAYGHGGCGPSHHGFDGPWGQEGPWGHHRRHHGHHRHRGHHGHHGPRGRGRGGPMPFEAMRDLMAAAKKHRPQAQEVAHKLADRFEADVFEVDAMGEIIEDVRGLAENVSAEMLKRLSNLHEELSPRERQHLADRLRRQA